MDDIDNKSKVLYFNNNKSLSKLKRIEIKFLVVNEIVQSGKLFIKHISKNSIVMDLLTKRLPIKMFHEHIARISTNRLPRFSIKHEVRRWTMMVLSPSRTQPLPTNVFVGAV